MANKPKLKLLKHRISFNCS